MTWPRRQRCELARLGFLPQTVRLSPMTESVTPDAGGQRATAPNDALVWGHRGIMATENTLEGITKAMEHGLHGVEVDLQVLNDGEVVLFHDLNLDRLTLHQGPIAERSYADLAGCHLRTGQSIPRLASLLERWSPDWWLNLELKAGGGRLINCMLPQLERAVTKGWVDPEKVVLSSFSRKDLEVLHGQKQVYARALIVEPRRFRWFREDYARSLGVSAVHMHSSLCTHGRLRRLHKSGLIPVCWGGRSARHEAALVARGVQRVISDFPESHPVVVASEPMVDSDTDTDSVLVHAED